MHGGHTGEAVERTLLVEGLAGRAVCSDSRWIPGLLPYAVLEVAASESRDEHRGFRHEHRVEDHRLRPYGRR